MSLTILLEIGHNASLRSKISPEGFTHDWEVFVKGQNGAEIHYYVEKVVFHLHETFPKPKRVVKEPPFSLRTSGYAGFKLPIEIYLKNNQEPKKIRFNYDLELQPQGPPIHIVKKEKFTFSNPAEEFRSKLLKGGAIEESGNQESSVNRISSEEKNQMTSKPKLSGSDITKKHKMKFEEPRTTDFENLFGPPIKKNSKLPEQTKPRDPPPLSKPPNTEKSSEKEKSEKSKSNKSVHKDKDKENPKEKSENSDKKNKEEKKKSKDEKSKDKERSKEKSSKKDKERDKSPIIRPRSPSPKRSPKRDLSPPLVQKHSSSKEKESSKEDKKDKERDKEKKEDKKYKKEKRDHKEGKHKDREKDKEHREHKSKDKDSKSSRDKESSNIKLKENSPLPIVSVSSQTTHKTDKKSKDKEHNKEQLKEEDKIEKIDKSDRPEKIRPESEDRQNKHKHKKKDRKEKKEDKHSKKEERKSEKQPTSTSNLKDLPKEAVSVQTNREIDKSNLFGSPKSNSPSTPKEPEIKTENNSIFSRDDESSNDSVKMSSREASPVPRIPSKSPSPLPPPEPIKKTEPEKKKEPSPKKKDKKEKKKDKKIDKEHEKRKKRKLETAPVEPEPAEKVIKTEEDNTDEESKVSSTEDTNTTIQPKSEFDMDMLRDLQQKIMSLKDSADLQRVVQLIAETGQYEISANTFDFDLCLLDRSTVRQLQDFFSTIS